MHTKMRTCGSRVHILEDAPVALSAVSQVMLSVNNWGLLLNIFAKMLTAQTENFHSRC